MIQIPNNRLNGYNIIAQAPVFRADGTPESAGEVVLLGHDPSRRYPKYVTALASETTVLEFGEWFWGHYFEGTPDALQKAMEDFVLRTRIHLVRKATTDV